MYTIRPFQPTADDYRATVAIYNAVWPDERPLTVAMCRQNDEEWPAEAFHHRFVVERQRTIVGQGACYEAYWTQQPGLIHLDFEVHPDHAGHGVEELLYTSILAQVQQDKPAAAVLATSTREDRVERVEFLRTHGFQPVMRSPQAALSVSAFEPSRFQTVAEQVARQGIRIYTLAELYEQEPDWKQKLCDLRWALLQDVPAVEPPTPLTMADFERIVLDDPALDPEAFFVAVSGTQPATSGVGPFVGQSNLWINDPTYRRLDTGLTGVVRSHRRRGIATALKLRTVEYAQRQGAETIETSNEENNPMYELNLKLGFLPKPAWVSYRKQLTAEKPERRPCPQQMPMQ